MLKVFAHGMEHLWIEIANTETLIMTVISPAYLIMCAFPSEINGIAYFLKKYTLFFLIFFFKFHI